VAWLEQVARSEIDAVIDAEVLQEILHRYRAIRRWRDGRRLYDHIRRLVPVVVPIGVEILDRARVLLDQHGHLMARDALHAAVVLEHEMGGLCSFDSDFDDIQGITRIEPPEL
jgi:predicted nucleic acid-binding protein